MAYRSFTAEDISGILGLTTRKQNLFPVIVPLGKGEFLTNFLDKTAWLPKRSEKARSEMIVFPILLDLCEKNEHKFVIYSGENLKADAKRKLNGECDYILSKNTEALDLNVPIFTLVEAKREQIIEEGIPQCAAQMLGAQIYNQQKNSDISCIYGCVTTGQDWKFLKLENNELIVDTEMYFINEVERILGVFQQIIDNY